MIIHVGRSPLNTLSQSPCTLAKAVPQAQEQCARLLYFLRAQSSLEEWTKEVDVRREGFAKQRIAFRRQRHLRVPAILSYRIPPDQSF